MEPFRYRRKVGFGECDPARIFFAPRAIDYAVEAVELFCAEALGLPWAELVLRRGREARVLAVGCAYERSITAGQEIDVVVEPSVVGADTFTLSAVAELSPGEVSFRATIVLALVERGRTEPLKLPPELVARLAARVPAGAPPHPEPGRTGTAVPETAPGAPTFTLRRRVGYGDCGVSGDVYPPRVAAWAVEAAGEWYEAQLGTSWIEQCRRGRGEPFLGIRCDHLARMEPGQLLTIDLSVPRLGKASIGYAVVGRDERGAPCFRAEMSACYITEEDGPPRSMPFPDELRARILAFQAGGGAPK